MDKLYQRIVGIHLISCLFTSFLASIKLPRCLSFCLSYLLLNNYWATQHQISIFIQPGKVLSDKGKLSGGNSDGNIAYLKNNNVHMYLFLQAKENCILQVLIFSKWQVYENFVFINFSLKEKRIRKGQLNQGIFG